MVSQSLVEAWETGRQGILPDHMGRLLGIQPDGTHGEPLLKFPPEFMVRMVEALVLTGEAAPEFEGKWMSVEGTASFLWSFENYLISGYLQTSEYMHAVLSDETAVKRRLERQKILLVIPQPQLIAVMSESALRHNVGGAEVMAAQLDYLAECAKRDSISISVIPADSKVCAKFESPFTLAMLDDGRQVAHTTHPIRGEVIELSEDLAILRKLFELYRDHALRADESISLIQRIAEQWKH